jgi:hypothetical protein
VAKNERRAAEAHDAAIRKLLKSRESAWQDKLTVLIALGGALPENPLTSAEKKQIKKRADKIVNDALLKLIDGEDVDPEMRSLLRASVQQRERGPGRPKIQKGPIIEAVRQEYRKHFDQPRRIKQILGEIGDLTGLRIRSTYRPMHKQILGAVGDRVGLEIERMKQLGPSRISEFNKAVKRVSRKRRRK